jgi:hypothetical protein
MWQILRWDNHAPLGATFSGLGAIAGQSTSCSQLNPLFLEAGCSIKYLRVGDLVNPQQCLQKKRMSHLHPKMKRPIIAKLSAQKNEIQSQREPKGGARGIELRKEGRAKISPLNIATLPNSACNVERMK